MSVIVGMAKVFVCLYLLRIYPTFNTFVRLVILVSLVKYWTGIWRCQESFHRNLNIGFIGCPNDENHNNSKLSRPTWTILIDDYKTSVAIWLFLNSRTEKYVFCFYYLSTKPKNNIWINNKPITERSHPSLGWRLVPIITFINYYYYQLLKVITQNAVKHCIISTISSSTISFSE